MAKKAKKLMRYDVAKDEMVPVTQAWVNEVQTRLLQFALLRDQFHVLSAPGALGGDSRR